MGDDDNPMRQVCEVAARLLKENCKDGAAITNLQCRKGNEDPAIDMKEYSDKYDYVVSLPGSWWATGLTVQAVSKDELEFIGKTGWWYRGEDVKYLSQERIGRDFKTKVQLPPDADINEVSVDRCTKHGMVTVNVMKFVPPCYKTRKIPISS